MGAITRRPRARSVLQWAALLILVFVASGFLYVHFAFLDGIRGVLLSVVFPDSTVYAPEYSEEAFRRLGLSADQQEVIRALGPPLEKDSCDALERWHYSKSASDSHYRVRLLVFKDGYVVERIAYYLVD